MQPLKVFMCVAFISGWVVASTMDFTANSGYFSIIYQGKECDQNLELMPNTTRKTKRSLVACLHACRLLPCDAVIFTKTAVNTYECILTDQSMVKYCQTLPGHSSVAVLLSLNAIRCTGNRVPVNGRCKCPTGFIGKNCDLKACSKTTPYGDSSTIMSPGYLDAKQYPPNLDCYFWVKQDGASQIRVYAVQFFLKAGNDRLEIIDPSTGKLLQRWDSSKSIGVSFVSASQELYLRFITDRTAQGKGFHLKVEAI